MESASTTGEIFGYEGTANVVHRCCARALGADALIGELFAAVQRFAAGEPQEDDMTCMVLRVEA
jgi:serine phosphatase RsbU (regulator of sigma subunit)